MSEDESYIFRNNIILFKKFSEIDCIFGKYSNSKLLDNKIIVLHKMPYYIDNKKITDKDINFILDKIKNYEIVIIEDAEHIWIDGWFELLNQLNQLNKVIFFQTFTIGVKHYIDKKLPNNNIFFNTIKNILKDYYVQFPSKKINITDKRKFLLKHFSYNRTPHRDYVTDFLIKNNLIENNNITFHNYPFDELADVLNLNKVNHSYYFSNMLLSNVDLKKLNNLRIIPESEKFDIKDTLKQFENGKIASTNSYFEIVSEAQMPFSNDPESYLHFTFSITRRFFNPIFYGNVFHIMPNSIIFENDLKNIGIELFFKNNEDFLDNLNEDFYFDKQTQLKLKHNFHLLETFSNESKKYPFYLEQIERIFSVKFQPIG
ncbi:MAG: hypothetical protein FJ375_04525 [Pelagibacterales bacterium]|nr:hypothetical protein [Pelagibacterales bacterium]